jgi:hypothetical protein
MLIIPLITAYSVKHITFSMGKIYLSIIMSLLMIISEIAIFDMMVNTRSIIKYIIYISILLLYIYLYRNQLYIDDINYLKEMKEHHSKSLLTSFNRKNKSKNNKISSYSNFIVINQNKEIDFIDKFIM